LEQIGAIPHPSQECQGVRTSIKLVEFSYALAFEKLFPIVLREMMENGEEKTIKKTNFQFFSLCLEIKHKKVKVLNNTMKWNN